jgi:hypothetical protein
MVSGQRMLEWVELAWCESMLQLVNHSAMQGPVDKEHAGQLSNSVQAKYASFAFAADHIHISSSNFKRRRPPRRDRHGTPAAGRELIDAQQQPSPAASDNGTGI